MRTTTFAALLAAALWSAVPAKAEDKPANPQSQKMNACIAQAAKQGLKGNTRRAFMNSCLKGGG